MSDPCDPIGYKLSHCSVHEISLIRILTWVSFFRGSSWSRYQSCISCTAGDFLHHRQILNNGATREAYIYMKLLLFSHKLVSDSLWPHELQHARLPGPSVSHQVCSNSYPLNQWCVIYVYVYMHIYVCIYILIDISNLHTRLYTN